MRLFGYKSIGVCVFKETFSIQETVCLSLIKIEHGWLNTTHTFFFSEKSYQIGQDSI